MDENPFKPPHAGPSVIPPPAGTRQSPTISELAMKAPDVFGIVVRTLGLLCTFYGAYVGLWTISPTSYTVGQYLLAGCGFLFAGLVMLLGADGIVRLTYRGRPPLQ